MGREQSPKRRDVPHSTPARRRLTSCPKLSMRQRRSQVERQWEFKRALLARRIDFSGSVTMILESREPARLSLVGIDRLGFVIAPARMGDMIDAAAQRPAVPGIDQVKGQWRMHGDGRVQT